MMSLDVAREDAPGEPEGGKSEEVYKYLAFEDFLKKENENF